MKMVLFPCVVFLVHFTNLNANMLSNGISSLGFALSEVYENSENTNFVISPYSAHCAFSQVLLGARFDTKTELESVLGVQNAHTLGYKRLKNSLRSQSSMLQESNIMALAKGLRIVSGFKNGYSQRFDSEPLGLDFISNKAAGVRMINGLVSSATNGKITEIIDGEMVDENTRLILVNAIYFKALWKTKFDRMRTRPRTFMTPTGPVQTRFMTARNIPARHMKHGNYEILEIPYADEDKSFIIIIPQSGTSTSSRNIISNIKSINLNAIRTAQLREQSVMIPKFKMNHRASLKDAFKSLGVTSLFDESADLSGITNESLKVSDAVQEAFIEVNEEGTEAAAATAVMLISRSASVPFVADRPFVFLVHDFNARVTLFVGKLVNPLLSM